MAGTDTCKERLKLTLQAGNPPSRLGVLCFQFRNPLVARIVHDQHSLRKNRRNGEEELLNSYPAPIRDAPDSNKSP